MLTDKQDTKPPCLSASLVLLERPTHSISSLRHRVARSRYPSAHTSAACLVSLRYSYMGTHGNRNTAETSRFSKAGMPSAHARLPAAFRNPSALITTLSPLATMTHPHSF